MNIDGIVTTDGRVIVNEFNGRIGGCSHIHHILERAAGPRYGDELVVVSHSRKIDLTIDQAFGLLEGSKLAFDRDEGRGIIVTGEDAAGSGHLEYLSIAPSRADAMRLEAEFESMFGSEADARSDTGIEHLAKILSHMPPVRQNEAEKAIRDALRHGTAHKP